VKLLLVEDDAKLSQYLKQALVESGYAVDHAANLAAARPLATSGTHDLIILDLMLGNEDGLQFLTRLRAEKIATPVVILSAKHTLDEKLSGLRAGSDDYLTKPFSLQELLLRIEGILRRSKTSVLPPSLEYSDLKIDLLRREAVRDGTKIELQQKEFLLLEYMLENPEKVLTKSLILERVWDYRFDPQTNVVDVLVCRLRSKIDRGHKTKLIHTIRGVGYALKSS
jgi:two-component system OmpR family response regulator